jgi:hypothetical protein
MTQVEARNQGDDLRRAHSGPLADAHEMQKHFAVQTRK